MTQLPAIMRDRLYSAPIAVLTPRAAPARRDAQGPHQEGKAKNMPGVVLEQVVCPSSLLSNTADLSNSSILRGRQSLLQKVWLALQDKNSHIATGRALI